MDVKKFSMIKENIIDDMEADRKRHADNDKKNIDLDADLRKRQAEYQKEKPAEADEQPDFNLKKTEIVDQIGEIIFYALRDGNEEPLNEVKTLIAKYPNYLKSKTITPVASGDVKTFTNYSTPNQSEIDGANKNWNMGRS